MCSAEMNEINKIKIQGQDWDKIVTWEGMSIPKVAPPQMKSILGARVGTIQGGTTVQKKMFREVEENQ